MAAGILDSPSPFPARYSLQLPPPPSFALSLSHLSLTHSPRSLTHPCSLSTGDCRFSTATLGMASIPCSSLFHCSSLRVAAFTLQLTVLDARERCAGRSSQCCSSQCRSWYCSSQCCCESEMRRSLCALFSPRVWVWAKYSIGLVIDQG